MSRVLLTFYLHLWIIIYKPFSYERGWMRINCHHHNLAGESYSIITDV